MVRSPIFVNTPIHCNSLSFVIKYKYSYSIDSNKNIVSFENIPKFEIGVEFYHLYKNVYSLKEMHICRATMYEY